MNPDFSDSGADPDPVPNADLTNPQSLNLYSYVQNNPLTNTDPDGHDCVDTTNAGSGSVAVTAGSACQFNLGPNSFYVNGTVTPGSFTSGSDGSIGYSYTSYDGQNAFNGVEAQAPAYGPLEGPANQAGLNLLSNSAGVVNAAAGLEFDAAGLVFPIEHLAVSALSGRYQPGVQAAGISRKPGTLGQFGDNSRENKIAHDIAKKLGWIKTANRLCMVFCRRAVKWPRSR